jgi:hypothetical protein
MEDRRYYETPARFAMNTAYMEVGTPEPMVRCKGVLSSQVLECAAGYIEHNR